MAVQKLTDDLESLLSESSEGSESGGSSDADTSRTSTPATPTDSVNTETEGSTSASTSPASTPIERNTNAAKSEFWSKAWEYGTTPFKWGKDVLETFLSGPKNGEPADYNERIAKRWKNNWVPVIGKGVGCAAYTIPAVILAAWLAAGTYNAGKWVINSRPVQYVVNTFSGSVSEAVSQGFVMPDKNTVISAYRPRLENIINSAAIPQKIKDKINEEDLRKYLLKNTGRLLETMILEQVEIDAAKKIDYRHARAIIQNKKSKGVAYSRDGTTWNFDKFDEFYKGILSEIWRIYESNPGKLSGIIEKSKRKFLSVSSSTTTAPTAVAQIISRDLRKEYEPLKQRLESVAYGLTFSSGTDRDTIAQTTQFALTEAKLKLIERLYTGKVENIAEFENMIRQYLNNPLDKETFYSSYLDMREKLGNLEAGLSTYNGNSR